jgi:hypothetical protein
MITINLLPEELRKVSGQGTASTQMFVVGGSAIFALSSFLFFLFTHFHLLPSEQNKLTEMQAEREALRKYEKEHSDLGETIQFFKNHQQAVDRSRDMCVPFSRKIHELSSVVVAQNPNVWLSGLSISSIATGPGEKPKFAWRSGATCAAERLETATAFHKSLVNADFFRDFFWINVPKYTKQTLTGYEQSIAWNFDLEMHMQMQDAAPQGQ